jgi:predicted RNase H-like nuclease (RuvC/YqgF family)
MSAADITGPFFDRLDEMLSGGKKLSDLRAFLAPYREQFEALERDAKAENAKGAIKKAKAQVDDLRAEVKSLQAKLEEQQQVIEKLNFDLGQFQKAEKEQKVQPRKRADLAEGAVKVMLALAENNPQGMRLEDFNRALPEIDLIEIRKQLDYLLSIKLASVEHSFHHNCLVWWITDKGITALAENGYLK